MRQWCSDSFNILEELLDHITPRDIEEYGKSLPESGIYSSSGGRVWNHWGIRTTVEIQRLSNSNDMASTKKKIATSCAVRFAQSVCDSLQCPGKKAEWYIDYQRDLSG